MWNGVKIAESLWKRIFAALIEELRLQQEPRLFLQRATAGSPGRVQQAPVSKPVPQIKGLSTPTPAAIQGQFMVGPIPFSSSNGSFTLGISNPFLDILSNSIHPSFTEKQ